MNYQTKEQKLKKYVPIISIALYFLFRIWEFFVSFKSENYPANDKKVIFALWHHDQLCLDGIPNRDKLNILISKSNLTHTYRYSQKNLDICMVYMQHSCQRL